MLGLGFVLAVVGDHTNHGQLYDLLLVLDTILTYFELIVLVFAYEVLNSTYPGYI